MNRNKQIALKKLGEIMALKKLSEIIDKFNLCSTITESVEDEDIFIIIETWKELGIIQRELNRIMSPKPFYKNYIDYLNKQGNNAFQDMRVEQDNGWYAVPDGLHELNYWFDWGFSDEYTTCSNCGRSFQTSQSSYSDIPRYAIINDEILCHECIRNEYEEEYIESVTNKPNKALKINIIDEDRLAKLGWKQLPKTYKNGLHKWMNDKPSDVFNKLKKKYDVLFTYDISQFYVEFWAWIKRKEHENNDT